MRRASLFSHHLACQPLLHGCCLARCAVTARQRRRAITVDGYGRRRALLLSTSSVIGTTEQFIAAGCRWLESGLPPPHFDRCCCCR